MQHVDYLLMFLIYQFILYVYYVIIVFVHNFYEYNEFIKEVFILLIIIILLMIIGYEGCLLLLLVIVKDVNFLFVIMHRGQQYGLCHFIVFRYEKKNRLYFIDFIVRFKVSFMVWMIKNLLGYHSHINCYFLYILQIREKLSFVGRINMFRFLFVLITYYGVFTGFFFSN